MYDRELVFEIFRNITWSIEQIVKRFHTIGSSDDFLKDDIGLEKLDSICMQLITSHPFRTYTENEKGY